MEIHLECKFAIPNILATGQQRGRPFGIMVALEDNEVIGLHKEVVELKQRLN